MDDVTGSATGELDITAGAVSDAEDTLTVEAEGANDIIAGAKEVGVADTATEAGFSKVTTVEAEGTRFGDTTAGAWFS